MTENLSSKNTVTLRDRLKERIDPETLKAAKKLNEESTGSPLVDASIKRWNEVYKETHVNVNKEDGFLMTEGNKIKTSSPRNVVLIFQREPILQGIFKFNEFTQEIDVVRDAELPLNIGVPDDWGQIKKGQYNDHDMNVVSLFIEGNPTYGVTFTKPVMDTAIDEVAHMNKYNPVKDYFKAARKNWDGKHRIDHVFHTYLGADINETNELIAQIFFMEAAAKGLHPETKADYVLDLVGGQGIGKTTFFQRIVPNIPAMDLYTDQINSFTSKDDFAIMRKALIVNDDELTVSVAASFEVVKKFVTMQKFEYREPYDRKPKTFLKHFVLVRTTNESEYLRDKSGDRRFISILCHPDQQEKSPVTGLPDSLVKQLWGEAVWMLENTPDLFKFSQHELDLLEANRKQFKFTTKLDDDLQDILENKFANYSFITNKDLDKAFKEYSGDYSAPSRNDWKRIRYDMQHWGYKKDRTAAGRGFRKLTRR